MKDDNRSIYHSRGFSPGTKTNFMDDLFNQSKYQPKNKSVLRLIRDFEKNYGDVFSKVKIQWLPAIREFLREETGLRIHQKVVGTKIKKDSNLSFSFIPDREEVFIKLIDQQYPDLDFYEYAAFKKLHLELKNTKQFFSDNSENPLEPYSQLIEYLDNYFKNYDLNILLNTLFKKSGRIC